MVVSFLSLRLIQFNERLANAFPMWVHLQVHFKQEHMHYIQVHCIVLGIAVKKRYCLLWNLGFFISAELNWREAAPDILCSKSLRICLKPRLSDIEYLLDMSRVVYEHVHRNAIYTHNALDITLHAYDQSYKYRWLKHEDRHYIA